MRTTIVEPTYRMLHWLPVAYVSFLMSGLHGSAVASGLLLGEVIGHMLEQRVRLAYLEGLHGAQQASATPSEAADTALDDRYVSERFRATCMPVAMVCAFIASCCAVMAPFLGGPLLGAAACTLSGACLLRLRFRSGRGARRTFGRLLVATFVVGFVGAHALNAHFAFEKGNDALGYAISCLIFAFGVTISYTSIEAGHRVALIVVFCLGHASLPALTTLGTPAEKVLWCFALLLGEVVGFAIDVHMRDQFLREQARDEAVREAQKVAAERERAAEQERKSLLVQREAAAAEREAAARAQQAQATLLDRIFATSHDALMLCELPAAPEQPPTLLRCSPNTHSILGVPADADPFTAAFTAEQQRAIGADVELLAAECFFPERIQTLAHSGVVLACSGHMVDDTRFLVTMRDVTEAKHMEMCKAESAVIRALDSAFDLVAHFAICETRANLVWVSASHSTVLGHPLSSYRGDLSALTHLHPPSFMEEHLPKLIASLHSGEMPDGFTFEAPMLHADGHEVWFECRIKRMERSPCDVLIISRDITDRRERHRLELENARLEVARQKDEEATHMLAHELKNRFIGVRGHVENARLTVEEKAGHLLQAPHNLQEAFADATAAVDRGLFLCMNRAVTLQLVHGAYEPRSMDLDVAKELLVASAKRCDVHVDAGVPRVVRLDSNLLLFVAENFIANAQNYGPVGRGDDKSITLRASCEGARLRIVVTNNPGPRHADARREYGDGDATARILDKGGLQKSATSTGHGLRIVKRCVDMLRGSTSLRFLANRVEASLSVPFAVVEHGKKVDLPPGLRVAAVDDADYIRQMDADCFASLGVDAVLRGATADEIATFPAFVARMRPPPQVVLLDENLDDPQTLRPFVKGTDLIARLREGGYENKVVIRSANQASADRARYRACGADASLDKGLSQEAFARELASILDGTWTWSGVDASKLSDGGLSAQHASEFAKRVPPYLEEARRRADAADVDGAWAVVHQVKALALMLGAKEVASACEALRSGWTAPLFERVETEAREVLSALSANGERTAGAEAQPLLRAGSLASGDSFRARSQVFIDELRQALARGAPCDGILHQLSGCSSMAGASRLAHFAQRAEKSAEPFGDDQCDQLESIWRATLDAAGLPAPQPSEAGRHRS